MPEGVAFNARVGFPKIGVEAGRSGKMQENTFKLIDIRPKVC